MAHDLPGPVNLVRGSATVPLAIDVPFHPSFLKTGVASYRQCLMRTIRQSNVNVAQLEGRFIPNLIAEPFEVMKQYFEKVFAVTDSEVIKQILD